MLKMAAEEIKKPREQSDKGLGTRHVQAVMLFLAMVIAFTMRVNMSLAIVAMTDRTKPDSFPWDIHVQSVVLSSYFWGYVVLQLPSGALAAVFGGKALIALLVAVNSLMCLLLPLAAQYGGWQAVCSCRVVQGLAQGFLYTAIHTLISKWVPPGEKGRLGTFIYAGGQFGTAFQLMTSGFIVESWGWQALFYINGSVGVIWTIIYLIVGSESPSASRIISEEERRYIEDALGHTGDQKTSKTPWKSIVTSLPVYALVIAHCGQNWGFWTLMTEIPSYMHRVLGVQITSNGVLSALPYIAMYLMSFPYGYFTDMCIRKRWLSVTATRKLSNSLGFYGPALALVGLSYVPAGDVTVAVVVLTAVVGLNAGQYTGYLLVHIDMAPNFAGILMGISNFFANITGILAPLVAGSLVQNESDAGDWRKVFFVSSAVYVAFNTFYVLFGSSRLQPWNEPAVYDCGNGSQTNVIEMKYVAEEENKPEKCEV